MSAPSGTRTTLTFWLRDQPKSRLLLPHSLRRSPVIPDTILILGGARSGKSRHAEQQITAHPAPWLYLATAQALDAEMQDRIADHQARRGQGWLTVEAPIAICTVLDREATKPILLDCLTLWLSNLMLAERDPEAAIADLEIALKNRRAPTVLVSNEVGLGIVPDSPLGRAFRDQAGRLNQRIAALATHVTLMVAGLPLTLK